MDKSEIYDSGKVYPYWKVQELKDEKMLVACEKAVEVILSHDWRYMHYETVRMTPYERFEVEGTEFEDCTVVIINDEGTIISRFSGKFSKESLVDDFEIDLSTHPKVGELRQYSYEEYLKDKYFKK